MSLAVTYRRTGDLAEVLEHAATRGSPERGVAQVFSPHRSKGAQ
jgi:hypothetical protein